MPTDTSDDCCVANAGLCHRHARAVLPQLKEPWWYRQVKTGDAHRSDEAPEQVRKRQKHERTEQLKRTERRRSLPHARLATALTGAFVINRRKAA